MNHALLVAFAAASPAASDCAAEQLSVMMEAGVRDAVAWQIGVLSLPFPPAVPQRIGSHEPLQ